MARIKSAISEKEQQERKSMAQLKSLDAQMSLRRRELSQVNDETAFVENRIRSMRGRRNITDAELMDSRGRLGDFLRAWFEGDRVSSSAEVLLACAEGEADRLSNARMSQTELVQRESRLNEYMRRLTDLKAQRTRTERALRLKREERARLISGLRRQIRDEKAMLRVAEAAAARLERAARQAEAQAQTRSAEGPPASARIAQLAWPVRGRVITSFGRHKHKEFNAVINSRGIEIAAEPGKRVAAAAAGQVAFSDWLEGYGRVMIVDHGGGFYTVYGHLQDSLVPSGSKVTVGMTIGTVDEAGLWGSPSLYFEVRDRGRAIDPLRYLRRN